MLKIGSGARYDIHIQGRQIPRAISISFCRTRGSAAIPPPRPSVVEYVEEIGKDGRQVAADLKCAAIGQGRCQTTFATS